MKRIHPHVPILLILFFLPGAAAFGQSRGEERIVLDDFESGASRWIANDINKQEGHGQVLLCEMQATKPGAPEGTKAQGATLTFKRAADSWASVSLPVDGVRWKEKSVRQIAFWMKGDGSPSEIDLMLRSVSGTGEERKFSACVPLADTKWHKVVLPLSDFTFQGINASQRVAEIYLLQFVKRGTWTSLFFTIDDLVAAGGPAAPPPPKPEPSPSRTSSSEAVATAQFDSPSDSIVRTALGANIGPNFDLFVQNEQFRKSVQVLGIRYIRIKASQAVVMQKKDGLPVYDFSRLPALIQAIRSIAAEPLICIDRNPDWKLTDTQLLAYCGQLIRAVNGSVRKPVTLWEMLDKPTFGASAMVVEESVSLYNRMRAAALSAGKGLTIGGVGLPSPWQPHLEVVMERAAGLEFLSHQLYGTHNNSTSDEDLMHAARKGISVDLPNQIGPEELRSQLAANGFSKTPIYITEAAPNSAQSETAASADKRLITSLAAAWYATLLATCAPCTDAVFPVELTGPSWGLLDSRGRAFPSYYGLWMFTTYFPPGTTLIPTAASNDAVVVLAGKTRTAANVLLVNTGDRSVVCQVNADGLDTVSKVRIRLLESKSPGMQFNELSAKPNQRVALKGYSIAVLQFIQ